MGIGDRIRMLWLFILIVLGLMVIVSGCNLFGGQSIEAQSGGVSKTFPVISHTKGIVKSVNWLTTLSIAGVGLSVFALANGMKIGLAGVAGCSASLFMSMAVYQYSHILAICGLIGAILLCVASIIRKNRAITEIVSGVEKVKKAVPHIYVSDHLRETQTHLTKKMVQNIRAKLG